MVVFDTSVMIDQLRTDCYAQRMADNEQLVRTCSVVLAELWRGVTTPAERAFLRTLELSYPIFTLTEKNWLDSGQILRKIQSDHGFEPRKLRDLHFDVLIALTARSRGAMLITSNRGDFELIREYRDFKLEVW
jgi:predicted nucleic acid-binding protein